MSAPARLAAPLPPMPLGASWSQVFELYGQSDADPRTPAAIRLHLARRDRRPLAADEIIVLSSANGAVTIDGNRFTVACTPAQTAAYTPGLYDMQLIEVDGANEWCRLVAAISLEAGPVLAEAGDLVGPPLTGAAAGAGAIALYLSETIRVVIGAGDTPGLATRVSTEEVTRATADTSLTSRLSAEEGARAAGDASLTTRVSAEEVTRAAGDASLTTRLSTEEAARAAADTSLTTRLSTEEATRSAADTSLTSRVSTVEAGYLPKSGGVLTGALRCIGGVVTAVGLAVGAEAGTGFYQPAAGTLGIAANGTHVATFAPGVVTVAGVVKADADGTRDLGESATRWRDGYLSGAMQVGSVRFGGSTSSFPMWDRSGAQLRARLADGSGFTSIRATGLAFTNGQYIDTAGSDGWLLSNSSGTAYSYLYAEAANTLALRNGTTAQELRLYGTYTDASNFSRLRMYLSGSTWTFASSALGTGPTTAISFESGGNLSLGSGGTANQWRLSTGTFGPVADNTYDLASPSARVRSGYFGTNVVIGYSTTSAAQLHVGAGANGTLHDGAGASITPQVINSQTSGAAAIGVCVNDGTYNRRAGLFVDQTNGYWGLTSRFSSGAIPFIIYQNGAERFRLDALGAATIPGVLLVGPRPTGGASGAVEGYGQSWSFIGSHGTTDVADKAMRLGMAHYTNAEEPVVAFFGYSSLTATALAIGGGTSVGNAATSVGFYTAANTTTTTGTLRWQIDGSGHLLTGTDGGWDIGGASSGRPRDINVQRNATVGGNIEFQASSISDIGGTNRARQVRARNVDLSYSADGSQAVVIINGSTGVSARAGIQMSNDGGSLAFVALHGSGTAPGIGRPNMMVVQGPYSAGVGIHAAHASGVIDFITGGTGSSNTRWRVQSTGDLITPTDNAYMIGGTASGRPSVINAATSINAPLMILADGVTAPSATAGQAKLFVDSADGDLKVIFGDGTVKTIVADT